MAKRISRVFFAMSFVVSVLVLGRAAEASGHTWGDIVGPVTATSLGVYMPTTLAQVATLTEADLTRIRAAAFAQLPKVRALIEAGVIVPASKADFARPRSVTGTGAATGGRLAAPTANHLYSDARCSIDWQGYPFSGTYVWAWGQTVSNQTARDHVYGTLYQNGSYRDQFGQDTTGTVAYSSTTHWRVAWWDHPTFVVNSDHWIKPSGSNSYDWGPWYCSVSKTI